MRSPVLFLVFNRPETTRRVFDALRSARPGKLYIAADGPRRGRPGELEICDEVRAIASAVDWSCDVKKLFRDENLGCKRGVSEGIAWFFSHEPEGIILEDDILPTSTFFVFCDEMLERYRNDPRVAMIAGCNLVSKHFHADASYFFTHYCNIWGWATWRRAWQHYDVAMAKWPAWRDAGGLNKISGGRQVFDAYWRSTFDNVHGGKIDTWDYQWTFSCWRTSGLTILPAVNQIENLGFGAGATHTTADAPKFVLDLSAQPITFPLVHPQTVECDRAADAAIGSRVFGINAFAGLTRRLLRIPIFRSLLYSLRMLVKDATR